MKYSYFTDIEEVAKWTYDHSEILGRRQSRIQDRQLQLVQFFILLHGGRADVHDSVGTSVVLQLHA